MQKNTSIILFFLFLSSSLFSQSLNSLVIQKFKNDINYSNLWQVTTKKKVEENGKGISLDSLIDIKGGLVYFLPSKKNDTYTYEFYFLKSTSKTDPIVPIVLKEKHEECVRNAEGALDCKVTSYEIIFQPRDFVNLKYEFPDIYNRVIDYLSTQAATASFTYFKFDENKDKTARNNADYIDNARINSNYHHFDSTYKSQDLYVDLSFSKLTLSYTPITNALGFAGFGFEVSTGDKMLSLLPYQSPYIGWGGSMLINFGGNDTPLNESFFADLKFLVKSKVNTYDFSKDLNKNLSPVFSMGVPNLNINNGYIFDLNFARFFDKLPFISFSYSHSSKDFEKPNRMLVENGGKVAYFGVDDFEAALSFYFSLDKNSKNKIKLGLGAGMNQINKAWYDNNDKVIASDKVNGWGNITPVVYLDYTYQGTDTKKEPLFGGKGRFFDNRLNFTIWLKLWKTDNFELRFEDILVSDPIGRSMRDWETTGGNFIQFRTRFSL